MAQQAFKSTYSVVNGKLIRKCTLQVETYPDIEDEVRRMIRILEEIYELAITRGMGMKDQMIHDTRESEPVYPEPDSSIDKS